MARDRIINNKTYYKNETRDIKDRTDSFREICAAEFDLYHFDDQAMQEDLEFFKKALLVNCHVIFPELEDERVLDKLALEAVHFEQTANNALNILTKLSNVYKPVGSRLNLLRKSSYTIRDKIDDLSIYADMIAENVIEPNEDIMLYSITK